jgi:hypothetical protein
MAKINTRVVSCRIPLAAYHLLAAKAAETEKAINSVMKSAILKEVKYRETPRYRSKRV